MICILIIALPVVYAVGSLAAVYGAYAIAGLVMLFVGLLQGVPFQSGDDFVAFLGIGGMALALLLVCSAVIYGIWRVTVLLIAKLRAL